MTSTKRKMALGGHLNIWIYNHYADPPERQATRTFDLAAELVKKGHQVTIFAASFSHYTFQETRTYHFNFYRSERIQGVRFTWLRTFPYQKNDWRRVVNMLTYCLGAGLASFRGKPDVIIGVTVHPFAAFLAYLVSLLKHARFYFEITDLWPETLIEFGKLSAESRVAKSLYALEKFLMQHAVNIIVLHRYLNVYTHPRGIPNEKLVWIPHGANLAHYHDLPPYAGKHKQELFTIMYTGGIVWSNDLDTIIEAAALVKHIPVQFIIVGDGTDKPRLEEKVRRMGLENVNFHPVVPKSELSRVMAQADAFIMGMRNFKLYEYGISTNKLITYLASQRPILFAGLTPGNPVAEANAGFVTPTENPQSLAEAIQRLVSLTPEERAALGQNGLRYLKQYHDIALLANRLEAVLCS
ncbi:MAG: glycosyltransferase family 4 protein [Anaerolineae bacterium]|nr:MAG: glycosyltransferase family 4 protein [Anaerolineae bacterium]